VVRGAFSLLELIIAIIVIGISLLSIPLILTSNTKSLETSLQQEAVMGALTQIANIMSYKWDEGETNASINGGYAKILDTQSNASALDCVEQSFGRVRKGNFLGDDRRKCYNTQRLATAPDALGSDDNDLDDIDDFITYDSELISGDRNSEDDYKRDYAYDIGVVYINDEFDFDSAGVNWSLDASPVNDRSTNIKMVEVRVSSDNGGDIVLKAFSANIGEISYYGRVVQ